jgi:regulator of sirC expression with transglutaminase-like and TPR domain
MIPKTREDALIALKSCAGAPDGRFDATACAIACAIHEDPARNTSGALDVLAEITAAAQKRQPQTPQAFATFMFADLGFSGCTRDYDDPCQADFLSILATRQGLPVGLGLIWRHVARIVGVPVNGTDTPGHLIMRFETNSLPVFLDPFAGGAILSDDDLTALAQRAGLKQLDARMLRPVSDRILLIRLQTNLSTRARAAGDIDGWVRAAQRRAVLAPDNLQIALDYSEAAEAAGQLKVALHWSEVANALHQASGGQTASRALDRSQALRQRLN